MVFEVVGSWNSEWVVLEETEGRISGSMVPGRVSRLAKGEEEHRDFVVLQMSRTNSGKD